MIAFTTIGGILLDLAMVLNAFSAKNLENLVLVNKLVANNCLSLSYFPCIALGGLEAINFWAGKATFYLKGALLITIQQHTSWQPNVHSSLSICLPYSSWWLHQEQQKHMSHWFKHETRYVNQDCINITLPKRIMWLLACPQS